MPKAKTEKTFKGYFNYRILAEGSNLKTYYFDGVSAEKVESLTKQFTNPNVYHFFGKKVVEIIGEGAAV